MTLIGRGAQPDDIRNVWQSLKDEFDSSGQFFRRLPSSADRDVFLFTDGGRDGRRGLSVGAAGNLDEVAARLPDVSGLTVTSSLTRSGRVDVRIEESGRTETVVFDALIDDVVRSVSEVRSGDVLMSVCRRLELWKQFFTGTASWLTPNQQAGLFAELTVFRDVMRPIVGWEAAARSWYGPERALQDFADERVAIEVKSVSPTGPALATIANERQLDDSAVGVLLLAVHKIDVRDTGNGASLPQLVAEMRSHLAGDEVASSLFEDRLIRAGYSDAHVSRYVQRMTVRNVSWYQVSGAFPRLLERDLPGGISHVSYKVNAESCQEWELTRRQVKEIIREAYQA
ncbi:PD-(D/E)XK motif protein [Paenarthrobacter sp. CM16]|uniref:PD-(D/E)XK motif protein n=1 Tax=Paenarthrobacter sp. CM16 TaxID=2738447 RepID=UPI0015554F7A|nr:PD-(D/E)XK motif protein [Paenarthrobacter sp. CM16]NQD88850.1 PD-(D/E)XK motif protein [Paenarthrobacter sp. CM16]